MLNNDDARTLLDEIGFAIGNGEDGLSKALRVFQRSYGLDQTGEIDKATSAKLTEVHADEVPSAEE